jgi:ATP-dependent DNA ligase
LPFPPFTLAVTNGFRELAHVGPDETRLVSRRGNVYKRFTELAAAIHIELDCEAVLDGEIVCLDGNGRPQFNDLLRRRGEPVFYESATCGATFWQHRALVNSISR